jgi:hypothetical protein
MTTSFSVTEKLRRRWTMNLEKKKKMFELEFDYVIKSF